MSAGSKKARAQVGIGVRAIRGGGVVVGVRLEDGGPRVVLSDFLATAANDDRLSLEPYHVAAEMTRDPNGHATAEAAAAVAEGRKRQDQLAATGLQEICARVQEDVCEPVVAALLVNRAGWVTDLLEYSIAFADHPPVAEGLAVREAFRFAAKHVGLDLVELDEKSLPEMASEVLRLDSTERDARLKALGGTVGRPWRKEQKLACLAAWVSLAAPK